MAVAFKHFCTIKSRIKGDHIYKADPRINSTCGCFPEPGNTHSAHAIIVKIKESSTHHAAEQTAGHVPDSLAEILYQPLVDGNITSIPRSLDNPGVLQKALGSKEEDWRFLACMKFS